MVFRLLENAVASQKIESRHLYLCPRQNPPPGYNQPPGRGKLLIPQASVFFEQSIPPGGNYIGADPKSFILGV